MKNWKAYGISTALALFGVASAEAALKCQLRLGSGCNGPVVYEIQLCARVTFEQGVCRNLCGDVRPICKVSDYDPWVAAYDRKGRHGFHGELAQTDKPDFYDQSGQLAVTAGNTYTVCRSEAGPIGPYSTPVSTGATGTCPSIQVASPSTCGAGTVFNNDPANPRCITQNSYCSGGGSVGNFVSTMNAGFQMVAVQNEHFIDGPGQDTNLQVSAAIAGSELPGLVAPAKSAATIAAPFVSSNPSSRGSKSASAPSTGSSPSALGATGTGGVRAPEKGSAETAFAAKAFALDGSEYGAAGGSAGKAPSVGESGANWFSHSGAAAVPGVAGEEVGFEGARRGIASDGRLVVDDPENYFLMSDVEVSLFKRVTAQCRKKERALVLAP